MAERPQRHLKNEKCKKEKDLNMASLDLASAYMDITFWVVYITIHTILTLANKGLCPLARTVMLMCFIKI